MNFRPIHCLCAIALLPCTLLAQSEGFQASSLAQNQFLLSPLEAHWILQTDAKLAWQGWTNSVKNIDFQAIGSSQSWHYSARADHQTHGIYSQTGIDIYGGPTLTLSKRWTWSPGLGLGIDNQYVNSEKIQTFQSENFLNESPSSWGLRLGTSQLFTYSKKAQWIGVGSGILYQPVTQLQRAQFQGFGMVNWFVKFYGNGYNFFTASISNQNADIYWSLNNEIAPIPHLLFQFGCQAPGWLEFGIGTRLPLMTDLIEGKIRYSYLIPAFQQNLIYANKHHISFTLTFL